MSDGWNGGFQATDDAGAALSSVIECSFGDGTWVLETRDSVGEDYFWSEAWWQGFPTKYTWDFSGGDGGDLTLFMEMTKFNGNFIYDIEKGAQPGTGSVHGTATATWCEALSSSPLF
jgi:hypothetical protein